MDTYLTIAEAAELLKLSPKSVRNKIAAGQFQLGVHFYRPPGMTPRFKWNAVVKWMEAPMEAEDVAKIDAIPMPRRGRPTGRRTAADGEVDGKFHRWIWIDMATLKLHYEKPMWLR